MIFVDTSYLIALTNKKETLFPIACKWSIHFSFQKARFLTTEYVLWEYLNFSSNPSFRTQASNLVNSIMVEKEYEIVTASSFFFQEGRYLYQKSRDKNWSLTDCISFLVMRKYKMTQALTFDYHFAQAGFDPLLRREP